MGVAELNSIHESILLVIRGLQATMSTRLDFSYYRNIDHSEVDLVLDGPFGIIPVEVKLGSQVKRLALRGLERFLDDTKAAYGILVNRGSRVELLNERVVQIPIHYW